MTRPLIGITCYDEPAQWDDWRLPAAVVPKWYIDAIQASDADVVIVPPGGDPHLLDRLDGLVLVGGADVDARRYGAAPHPRAAAPQDSRDDAEFALYGQARKLGMPVLGICRGLQLMAVAHGGSLVQHLPDLGGSTLHTESGGAFVDHIAMFEVGSLACTLYGAGRVTVNSSHHQAVESAGDLSVTGWAEDGTVEVCEDPHADFCIGVQWHPEHPDRREADRPLITAFVDAAARFGEANCALEESRL